MDRLNLSWWNDTMLEMTEVQSMERPGWLQTFTWTSILETGNRDGNFETCWLPPQCSWNRNNSALVMEPCLSFQNKSKKPMSTKICAGSIWVMSMCVAGLLLASRRLTLSAAVCMERPGVCSVPSAPWKIPVSPYPVLSAGGLWEQVLLTSFAAWQFSFACISSPLLLISYFRQAYMYVGRGRAGLHKHLASGLPPIQTLSLIFETLIPFPQRMINDPKKHAT